MFNYIKWEFLNEFKSKKYLFMVIAIIYLLVSFIDYDSTVLHMFLYFAFGLIVGAASYLAFLYGSKKIINSYKDQTFLLESMIPLSPSKILFAKYVLAIIFDIVFSIIFVLGLQVLLSKFNINFIDSIIRFIFNSQIDVTDIVSKLFFYMFSATISFTALIAFLYVLFKSLMPNGKMLTVFTYGLGIFLEFVLTKNIISNVIDITTENGVVYFSLILLGITVLCYLLTVWFIEHKLEVYN